MREKSPLGDGENPSSLLFTGTRMGIFLLRGDQYGGSTPTRNSPLPSLVQMLVSLDEVLEQPEWEELSKSLHPYDSVSSVQYPCFIYVQTETLNMETVGNLCINALLCFPV